VLTKSPRIIIVLTAFALLNLPFLARQIDVHAHTSQPAYSISSLPELAQFQDVRAAALDPGGNLLANVSRLVTIRGKLVNDAHAVFDLHPGTARAHVVALRPPGGRLDSFAIGMNSSGTMAVEAGIPQKWGPPAWQSEREVPFVVRYVNGRMQWNRLYALPHYGSESVVGIADNGDVAGEIHGLMRKPRCCTILQQAVIWRPSRSGRYHSPTFLAPAKTTATAIWSNGKDGPSVVAGIDSPNLAVWTVPHKGCRTVHGCAVQPTIGHYIGPIDSTNEAITSMAGWGRTEYGVGERLGSCCGGSPNGIGQSMRFNDDPAGRAVAGVFSNILPPPKYRGGLCISGPWNLHAGPHGAIVAVGGAGCFKKPCISNGAACGYPPLTSALIWRNGQSRELSYLIPLHTQWWLKDAQAVNAAGRIAGTAWYGRKTVPFLLTPMSG
jgi:hypothetical protein